MLPIERIECNERQWLVMGLKKEELNFEKKNRTELEHQPVN